MTPPKLLLVPPAGETGNFWQAQKASLADVAEVITVEISEFDSISAMADAVLAATDDAFALGGLSLGGWVAMEVVKRAPERVTKLALMHSSGDGIDVPTREMRMKQIGMLRSLPPEQQGGALKQLGAKNIERFVHPDNTGLPAILETFDYAGQGRDIGAFVRNMTAATSVGDEYKAMLGTITCPTLLIGSKTDAVIPYDAFRATAAAIPNAKAAVIDNVGHVSPLEKPEAVAALLRLWIEYL